jgi:hypothetical protein
MRWVDLGSIADEWGLGGFSSIVNKPNHILSWMATSASIHAINASFSTYSYRIPSL